MSLSHSVIKVEIKKRKKIKESFQIFKMTLNHLKTNIPVKVIINVINQICNYQICIKKKICQLCVFG